MFIWSLTLAMATMGTGSSGSDIRIEAEPAPEIEALFRNTDGWIGADGDYSVPLDKNTLLWLFSDTFVGKISEGKRADWSMINNSAAVQVLGQAQGVGAKSPPTHSLPTHSLPTHSPPTHSPVRFHYKTGKDDKPASLITPDDGRGYFWLFGAVMTSKGLYVFMPRIENTGGGGAFGFRQIGLTLGHVSKPGDPPEQWKVEQTEVPFYRTGESGSVVFGSALMKEGRWVYIYGLDSTRKNPDGSRPSRMVVARAPEDKVGDFSAWRFYSKEKWVAETAEQEGLFEGIATEFSVCRVPGIRKYAVVYTLGGIFGKIVVRLAPKAEGPWGEPIEVYDCPDKTWHEKAFSYAAKAHPELSRDPNELIVTYATNSNNFEDLIDDTRLYWPRFVRLRFVTRP